MPAPNTPLEVQWKPPLRQAATTLAVTRATVPRNDWRMLTLNTELLTI